MKRRTRFFSRRRHVIALLILTIIGSGRLFSNDLVISEFLAINRNQLEDADEETPDWIELFNPTGSVIDLFGWYLTDDPQNPAKWRFPSVTIDPGSFLVVFASGKNRSDPSGELHTNFEIDGDGEYLALVRPDGASIEQEFAPEFPPQRPDISYGIGQAVTETLFVSDNSSMRFLVPESSADGLAWTGPLYSDPHWESGLNGLGYDTETGIIPEQLETENIAPLGTATQSSVCYDMSPDRAIDGDYNNFTHTCDGDSQPAWELDLGETFYIESVTLYNRSSCCGSRLRDITIAILTAAGDETVFASDLLNPENEGYTYPDGPTTISVDLVALTGTLVQGGIIRVTRTPDPDLSGTNSQGNTDEDDVLSLGEVEVIGAPADQPVGYHALIETDVEAAMLDYNASVYLRYPFTVDDPENYEYLKLRARYDDGFVAYLNGEKILEQNAPAAPAWNSEASAAHPDGEAIQLKTFDVSAYLDLLQPGANLLAIHALNITASDEDFLFAAELQGTAFLQEQATYFTPPTPDKPNNSQTIKAFAADTAFSSDRGFYHEPFSVHITCSTPGSVIRYTLDGTPPGPTHGTVYNDGDPLYIEKTTTLRAIACHDDPQIEPSNVDTQTYIFLSDVIEQDYAATLAAGFPASWGGTSPDYGMDSDVIGQNGTDRYSGKYTETIEEDLKAIPTLSVVMDIDDMFGSNGIYTNSTRHGVAWERAASVELIYPNGDQGFQENCGIRIQGGAFRSHSLTKKHSFRLLFKDDYGDTKLRYPLFGPDAADRFDTITLRSNSNDGWQWSAAGAKPLYIRDSFGRELMLAVDQPTSHETFVHLYINGIYWGLYNPVERPDESFSATYFGGDKETWDSLTHDGVHNGSWTAWNEMNSLAVQCSTSDPVQAVETFFRIQGKNPDGTDNPDWPHYLDVVNFADYMITNLYVGNTDWPHKNFWMGRDQREESTGYKFYMWDSEWSLGLRSDLNTNQVGVGANGIAEPWPYMRQNAEFRMLVADRLHRFFFNGGPLCVDPTDPAWNPEQPEKNRPAALFMRLADTVDRAVVAESARWGDQHASFPYTRDEHWEIERDLQLRTYFPQRSEVVLGQFSAAGLYPSLGAPFFNQHGGSIEEGFLLTMHAQQGTIYYTTDGTDPRLPGGAVSPSAVEYSRIDETELIGEEADLLWLIPSDGTDGLTWTGTDFDDAAWTAGKTGIGYERYPDNTVNYADRISTDIEDAIYREGTTLYIRIPFEIDDPGRFSSFTLAMQYDDGFAAYLNGTLIASRNCPDPLTWEASASKSHSDSEAVVYERFHIFDTGLVQAGVNVLAIHGLNVTSSSSDFLILPHLTAAEITSENRIELNETTTIRSRTYRNGEWSAMNEAEFRIPSPLEALKITEIMYNPPDAEPLDGEEYEFIEFQNTGDAPLDLSAAMLTEGVSYIFAEGTIIEPGAFLLLVKNREYFLEKYPSVPAGIIAGSFSLNLSNAGERIVLQESSGTLVSITTYDDYSDWPQESDGMGYSLVPVDVTSDLDPSTPEYWRASTYRGGSPGETDPGSGPAGGWQRQGDLNQDSILDLSDAISILLFLYTDTPIALPCGTDLEPGSADMQLLDVNGDAGLNIADAVSILSFLFNKGPEPVLGSNCIRIEGCPDSCR